MPCAWHQNTLNKIWNLQTSMVLVTNPCMSSGNWDPPPLFLRPMVLNGNMNMVWTLTSFLLEWKPHSFRNGWIRPAVLSAYFITWRCRPLSDILTFYKKAIPFKLLIPAYWWPTGTVLGHTNYWVSTKFEKNVSDDSVCQPTSPT